MKLQQTSGFTLIELLITTTIFIIISLMAFAPYGFYMNKAKVKFTNKELSQIIYEAKNMAIHGSAYMTGNISVGVFIDSSNINKDSYRILSFDHDIDEANVLPANGRLIQKHSLQPGVQIDSFSGEDQGIIFFRSITGSGFIVKGTSFTPVTENIVKIEYSYKGSSNNSLKGSLEYYQDTQIVDY